MIKRIYDYFNNMSFYKFLFFLQTIALILMFAFCSPIPANAMSQQTYFPMSQDVNGKMDAFVVNHIESTYPNKYYLCYGYNYISNYVQFHYIIFDDPSQLSVSFNSNGYQFSIYGYDDKREIKIQLPQYWYWDNQDYGNAWTDMPSDLYDTSISYVSNCDIVSPNGALIYLVPPVVIPSGSDPSAPNMSSLDLDSSLNTTTIPTAPTYSNNFNEPLPTWDSTAPFQSLFDIILWGFNRVHSAFQSFREYLFSWLGYFINILTYLIQKIIDAIKYIVSWLYNQFLNWLSPYLKILNLIAGFLFNSDDQKSVLDILGDIKSAILNYVNTYFPPDYSPITDKIEDFMIAFNALKNLFTADPNYAFIYNTFIGTYFGQIFTAGNTLLTAIVNAFREIQNPQTLVFTVNFTAAPSPFNQVGLLSFDFGWYSSIRSVIEPIVVCCLYIGCGLHILSSVRSLFGDTASLVPDTRVDSINTPAMNRARAESRARANAVRSRHRK